MFPTPAPHGSDDTALLDRPAAALPDWDGLVAAAAGGDLVQTDAWAASREALGFRCIRLRVSGAGGGPVGGCQIYARRIGPAIWAASVPRGPLVFGDDPDVAALMVTRCLAEARRHRIRFLVVQPPEGQPAVEQALIAAGFHTGVPSVAPEATIRLDLRQGDDALLDGMSPMRRRNIRKALRSGFTVTEEPDPAIFHQLHLATARRQGFAPVSLENLRAQAAALGPARMALVARFGGVPVAGIWLTRFAGMLTFKLAGWDADAPAPPHANELLHWVAIQRGRALGLASYDLGGFDRAVAERVLAGAPLPDGFRDQPGFYKWGFSPRPVLLPRARFALTDPIANRAFGPAVRRFLATPRAAAMARRLRG